MRNLTIKILGLGVVKKRSHYMTEVNHLELTPFPDLHIIEFLEFNEFRTIFLHANF